MNDKSNQSITSQRITVFVEDSLTKEYLSIIWADSLSALDIKVAGNVSAVRSLVAYNNANRGDCRGITDRDYRWDASDYTNNIFTLRKHEIENYLLDARAISKSDFNANMGLTEDAIRIKIDSFIRENKFWFACCYLLSKLNLLVTGQFPPNPNRTRILDAQTIIEYINESGYHQSLLEKLQTIDPKLIAAHVSGIVNEIEQVYSTQKQHDLFPGKEVFRYIRGILPGSNYADKLTMDIDLAKEIADNQVKAKRVPEELISIKENILINLRV
jgi:hypothetical protein